TMEPKFGLGRAANWYASGGIAGARGLAIGTVNTLLAALAAFREEALASLLPYIVRFVIDDGDRRAREGTLVFDDLIIRVRDLLATSSDVRKDLRRRCDALLIDEFQDTDPLQVDIALAIACPTPAAPIGAGLFFLAATQKQCSTRFRGADMAVLERPRKRRAAEGGALPELPLNRRSRRPLVEAVNAVFARTIGDGANPAVQ